MPTSRSNKRIVAITLGDPGGIGPEVTLKALKSPEIKRLSRRRGREVFFVLLGSPDIYKENNVLTRSRLSFNILPHLDKKDLSHHRINILDLGDDTHEVIIGKVAFANAALSYHSLEVGAYLAMNQVVDALVTAPINKEAVQLISHTFIGHTEYLARLTQVKRHAMLLQGDRLRVVLVTTHIPLHRVSSVITGKNIFSKIELTYAFLKKKIKIRNPVIGVAALNPHAGEGGKIGKEEIEIIIPAIKKAQRLGIAVEGPIPADVIFHSAFAGTYDAVVVMYHDQGLGPLKMIAFHTGVNVTLNLPFVRTSPDHGTAFNIAYQNKANPGSMIAAIKTAIDLM